MHRHHHCVPGRIPMCLTAPPPLPLATPGHIPTNNNQQVSILLMVNIYSTQKGHAGMLRQVATELTYIREVPGRCGSYLQKVGNDYEQRLLSDVIDPTHETIKEQDGNCRIINALNGLADQIDNEEQVPKLLGISTTPSLLRFTIGYLSSAIGAMIILFITSG